MKVTYKPYPNHTGKTAYYIYVDTVQLGLVWKEPESNAWHKTPSRGAPYRTRNDATLSLISSQIGDVVWCPNCQTLVEPEGAYDHEFGGHDHCIVCNEHVEEITP